MLNIFKKKWQELSDRYRFSLWFLLPIPLLIGLILAFIATTLYNNPNFTKLFVGGKQQLKIFGQIICCSTTTTTKINWENNRILTKDCQIVNYTSVALFDYSMSELFF